MEYVDKIQLSFNQIIILVVVSACAAPLLSAVVESIKTVFSCIRGYFQNKRNKEEKLKEEKKEIYLLAIDRLLWIRRGLDISKQTFFSDNMMKEKLEGSNEKFYEIAPKLRLYSSDKIFFRYQRLSKMFSKFIFPGTDNWHLSGIEKQFFDIEFSLLIKFMQEEIGIDYIEKDNKMIVECPKCKIKHNVLKHCPGCKMTVEEYENEVFNWFFNNDVKGDSDTENNACSTSQKRNMADEGEEKKDN